MPTRLSWFLNRLLFYQIPNYIFSTYRTENSNSLCSQELLFNRAEFVITISDSVVVEKKIFAFDFLDALCITYIHGTSTLFML